MDSPAPSLRLQQKLIVQGDLTMVIDGVPVMDLGMGLDAATVANFLRCGCPGVQLTSDDNVAAFTVFTDALKQRLQCLEVGGEEFCVSEHANNAENNPAEPYRVLMVTRVMHS